MQVVVAFQILFKMVRSFALVKYAAAQELANQRVVATVMAALPQQSSAVVLCSTVKSHQVIHRVVAAAH